MKLRYGMSAILASAVLLAGCTTDKGEMKAYNHQIEDAQGKEKVINKVDKEMADIQQDKQKIMDKLDGKNDLDKVQDLSKKLVKKIDKQQNSFKQETKAMKDSKDEYHKAHKHIKNIGNDKRRDAIKKWDKALDKKYQAFDDYADKYNDAMKKEKDKFNYVLKDDPDQKVIDKKNKEVNDAYKKVSDSSKKYQDASKKADEQKQNEETLQ